MATTHKTHAPLVTHIYTADPSAHVFNNTIYIYPSHDRETDIKFNDNGDQYDMADYHVLSLSAPDSNGPVTDHGVVLSLDQVPWASKQLWAPDAAFNKGNGKYYLFFPARDREGIFRIGVAVGGKPEGPFAAEKEYIPGSFSIDPCSFVDDDGSAYLYFGGLWGGQLQCWQEGRFDGRLAGAQEPSGKGVKALLPRVAKLSEDMMRFEEGSSQGLEIRDEKGELIDADDHSRRFFEGPWMHKRGDVYYFSYSTGDTHFIVYATGKSPAGPFTYRGKILDPVAGWTTHHSIVEFEGKWWLFYHDCELSKGVDHLRSVKVREIVYDEEGRLHLADPQ